MDPFSNGPAGTGPDGLPSDEMLRALEANGARMLEARSEHLLSTETKVQRALCAVRFVELEILGRFDPAYAAAAKKAAATLETPELRTMLSITHGPEVAEQLLTKMNMQALFMQRAESYFQTKDGYVKSATRLGGFLHTPFITNSLSEDAQREVAGAIEGWKEEARRISDLDPILALNERVIARLARRVDAGEFVEAISPEGYRQALKQDLPTLDSFDQLHRTRADLAPRIDAGKHRLLEIAIDSLQESRLSSSETEIHDAVLARLTWIQEIQERSANAHRTLATIEREHLSRALYGRLQS